jgi:hypothetical protein
MNYNNFSCRLVARRPAAISIEKTTPPPSPKKGRKSVRRRLVSALAVMCAVSMLAGAVEARAAEDLRVVTAPGTVPFAEGVSGADWVAETAEDAVPSLHEMVVEHVDLCGVGSGVLPGRAVVPLRFHVLTRMGSSRRSEAEGRAKDSKPRQRKPWWRMLFRRRSSARSKVMSTWLAVLR